MFLNDNTNMTIKPKVQPKVCHLNIPNPTFSRWLVAAEKNNGSCYCVNLTYGKCCTVQALIKCKRTITDVLVYETVRSIKVLVLFTGATPHSVGQQLAVFIVPEGKTLITDAADVLDLPGVYRTIWQVPGNPTVLIGSPYLSRQLRLQKVYDFKEVTVVDGLMTGHYVRLANLFVDRNWITSSAFDGLAFVRDKTVRRVVAYTMTHHRADFGCVKVMSSRSGDMMVSLGYNGSLVALRRVHGDKKVRLPSAILLKTVSCSDSIYSVQGLNKMYGL